MKVTLVMTDLKIKIRQNADLVVKAITSSSYSSCKSFGKAASFTVFLAVSQSYIVKAVAVAAAAEDSSACFQTSSAVDYMGCKIRTHACAYANSKLANFF
jgi:hypothetical protein